MTEQIPQNNMSIRHRIVHLIGHYLCGPLVGLNLKLIVADRQPSEPECFASYMVLGGFFACIAAPEVPSPIRFALLTVLLPILSYALFGISQLVLEYRAYLSLFGIALACGYGLQSHPLLSIPVIGIFLVLTRRRNRIYRNPAFFWKQASLDTGNEPSIVSNYLYELNKRNGFSEIDRIYENLIANRIPGSRTLLINMAAARFGSKEMWDEADLQKLSEARRILEEVVRRWPDHADGHRNLATVLYYERRPEQAVIEFSKAVKIQSQDSASWLGLGECHMYLGQHTYAANCFRTALSISPHLEQIRTRLMEALHQSGQLLEFGMQQQILKRDNILFVTDDMLPDHIEKN